MAERKIVDKPIEEPVYIEQTKIDIDFDKVQKTDKINVIGQFKNTYILVENEDNLELIDQHIAEERYIYEKLKRGEMKRVLLAATGALLSTVSSGQGESIPCICHAVSIERV